MESSRTSLASRTHFEVLGLGLEGQVLGLGLEASSPRKLACPRLEDSTIFWIVKILRSAWKIFWKTFFCGDRLKNFCEDLFFFFFWRALALVSLVLCLGLEHSCPWPRECLSSERLSLALALASDFFVSLALASSLVSSTPPLQNKAVKLIGRGNYLDRVTPYYSKLNILKLPDLYKLETAKFVYRFMHNTLPQSFSDFFIKVSEIYSMVVGYNKIFRQPSQSFYSSL